MSYLSVFLSPSVVLPLQLRRAFKLFMLVCVLSILSACKEPLFTKIKEADANEMMSILLSNGIATDKIMDKKDKTLSIHVEKSEFPTALKLLKQRGYPRESFKNTIDIFAKQGLVSSPMEERVRFIYALTQEVQETLTQIDGVVTARVHLVLPENDPFSEAIKPSSASVFIKSLPESHLEEIKPEIKFIVEKSIEGLEYEKISVVMLPTELEMASSDGNTWTNILGVRLPDASVNKFRFIIGALFTTSILLILIVIYLLKKVGEINEISDDQENLTGEGPQGYVQNKVSWGTKIVNGVVGKLR